MTIVDEDECTAGRIVRYERSCLLVDSLLHCTAFIGKRRGQRNQPQNSTRFVCERVERDRGQKNIC